MYGLAVARYRLNELEPALELLHRAVVLVPDAVEVHYLMGRILQQLGRTAESKREFALSARYQQKSTESLQQKFDREVRSRIREIRD
jgi:Flp pilus assembly protein TadD